MNVPPQSHNAVVGPAEEASSQENSGTEPWSSAAPTGTPPSGDDEQLQQQPLPQQQTEHQRRQHQRMGQSSISNKCWSSSDCSNSYSGKSNSINRWNSSSSGSKLWQRQCRRNEDQESLPARNGHQAFGQQAQSPTQPQTYEWPRAGNHRIAGIAAGDSILSEQLVSVIRKLIEEVDELKRSVRTLQEARYPTPQESRYPTLSTRLERFHLRAQTEDEDHHT